MTSKSGQIVGTSGGPADRDFKIRAGRSGMTPNFALDLSEDGIVLLHRPTPTHDWLSVATISLDGPNLAGELAGLRQIATDLEGEDFATEVILPPSQLLYAKLKVQDDPIQEVPRALEELTPYSREELRFDIDGTGPDVKVVAVASDTLREAEEFLGPYALNLTRFTARPEARAFSRDPDLGPISSTKVTNMKASAASDKALQTTAAPQDLSEEALPAKDTLPEVQTAAEDETMLVEPSTGEPVSVDVAERTAAPVARKPAPPLTADGSPEAFSSRRSGSPDEALEKVGDVVSRQSNRIAIPKPKGPKPPRITPAPVAKTPAMRASSVPPPPPMSTPRPGITPDADTQASRKSRLAEPISGLFPEDKPRAPILFRLAAAAVLFVAAGGLTAYTSGWLGDLTTNDQAEPATLEQALSTAPQIVDTLTAPSDDSALLAPEAEIAADLADNSVEPLELEASFTPSEDGLAPDPVQPLTQQEAQEAYLATGIWQRAPEIGLGLRPETLDDLYVASLDPELAFEDAPALSPRDSALVPLEKSPLPPPPAQTRFTLGPRGLVLPTPDGALNADGIRVILGQPPTAAEPRPRGAEEEAATPELDTRLAAIRPEPRPADLAETRERTQFGGLSRAELAGLRPQIRPESAQARADAIAEALAEANEPNAANQATEFAVASSLLPATRPRNFESVVSRAVRNSLEESPPRSGNPAAAAASTAALGRASGPAVVRSSRAAPTAPTRASVARAATENNAIALGRVALVGVFGTASNRRALVRMPNGRFRKVSVGDRVDGGRVAAIGDGQLRYTKGGRTLTLEMPSG
ncbi:MAG: hypothetical protein AAGA12_03025 [Pseudomonadota bacterium]